VLISRVADLVVDLAKLKAGAPIDNLSTRSKLSARKIKLTEQLAKVEEQLS
jgi:hypothetical protein